MRDDPVPPQHINRFIINDLFSIQNRRISVPFCICLPVRLVSGRKWGEQTAAFLPQPSITIS